MRRQVELLSEGDHAACLAGRVSIASGPPGRARSALGASPADISPHSFSLPGPGEPSSPFLADKLDQLFGSRFASLLDAVRLSDPAVPAAEVAQWTRWIWRLAGGTDHAAPQAEAVRRLIADQARGLAARASGPPLAG